MAVDRNKNRQAIKTPDIVIEGMEDVIARDLEKHIGLVVRSKAELDSYREARSHEIKRKRHFFKQIGGGKFNDVSLREAIKQIKQNVAHLSQKVKIAEDCRAHHQLIVDTLTQQLEDQNAGLKRLADFRLENAAVN